MIGFLIGIILFFVSFLVVIIGGFIGGVDGWTISKRILMFALPMSLGGAVLSFLFKMFLEDSIGGSLASRLNQTGSYGGNPAGTIGDSFSRPGSSESDSDVVRRGTLVEKVGNEQFNLNVGDKKTSFSSQDAAKAIQGLFDQDEEKNQ